MNPLISMEAPRQLPLAPAREFEPDVVMQHENDAGTMLSVQPMLQQDDNISSLQDRRLAYDPLQVMSPNQAIPHENQERDTFNVPNLPFSHAQRKEIFSETSSRMHRELCGPEGVVLQQNNILQQVIQEVHPDPVLQETLSEQQENIGQIVQEIHRLRKELVEMKLTLKNRGSSLLMKPVQTCYCH